MQFLATVVSAISVHETIEMGCKISMGKLYMKQGGLSWKGRKERDRAVIQ